MTPWFPQSQSQLVLAQTGEMEAHRGGEPL